MEINQNEVGFFYFSDKPKGYTVVLSPAEFFVLKDRKEKFIKDNIDLVVGCDYLVYSPDTGRYYSRVVHEHTSPYEQTALMEHINKKHIFILYKKEYRDKIIKQYKSCGLTYMAMVKTNEIIYELNEIEKHDKHRLDFQSVCAKLKSQIKWLSQQKKVSTPSKE